MRKDAGRVRAFNERLPSERHTTMSFEFLRVMMVDDGARTQLGDVYKMSEVGSTSID